MGFPVHAAQLFNPNTNGLGFTRAHFARVSRGSLRSHCSTLIQIISGSRGLISRVSLYAPEPNCSILIHFPLGVTTGCPGDPEFFTEMNVRCHLEPLYIGQQPVAAGPAGASDLPFYCPFFIALFCFFINLSSLLWIIIFILNKIVLAICKGVKL